TDRQGDKENKMLPPPELQVLLTLSQEFSSLEGQKTSLGIDNPTVKGRDVYRKEPQRSTITQSLT
ncbi:hypothetical protein J6590_017651, partial [Homalodisca vitripennis]